MQDSVGLYKNNNRGNDVHYLHDLQTVFRISQKYLYK